jgi:hypothetical protein
MNRPAVITPNLVFLMPIRPGGAVDHRLYLAMPALTRRLATHGLYATTKTCVGGGPIAWARAQLAGWYLGTEPRIEHAIWLDADVVPTVEHVRALLAVDGDVVAVPYPGRVRTTGEGSFWTCWARTPLEVREDAGHRLVALDGTGMGLVRTTRGALEAMGRAYPDLWGWCDLLGLTGKEQAAPFVFNEILRDLRDGRGPQYQYEDRSFCWRARRCGLRVEALCDMRAVHGNADIGFEASSTFAEYLGLPKRETVPSASAHVDLGPVYADLAAGHDPATVRTRYGLGLEASWPSAMGALRVQQPDAWRTLVARWGEEKVLQGCVLH